MRIFVNIIITVILIGLHCGLISCSGSKNIIFSQETFSISKQSGNIINSDSTLQFSFGNNIQESNMTINYCYIGFLNIIPKRKLQCRIRVYNIT